ncbi:MAG: NAD-binding protein, partial [Eubacteriales bacterium]|nr:NAD-binding protein [Eubacteriales bacterium]
ALRENSPLCGTKLKDLSKLLKLRILVCVVQRNGEVCIPDGNFELQKGDEIYVTAPANELIRLMQGAGLKTRNVKDVLIVGGSRSSAYLAEMLLKTGARVKIIEKDRARSHELADRLPEATIICDDGSSQSVLRRENARRMDAVVTLTNHDEENIIMSMYATHIGVPHVITKINRTEYNEILQQRGINCIISPKLLCANDIIHYVRSMQNTSGQSVKTIHSMADDKVEALEFEVTENVRHLGVPFMNIPLKSQILFACIYRQGEVIIPNGSSCLKVGDNVVVVTTANRVILDLNDIFNDGE